MIDRCVPEHSIRYGFVFNNSFQKIFCGKINETHQKAADNIIGRHPNTVIEYDIFISGNRLMRNKKSAKIN